MGMMFKISNCACTDKDLRTKFKDISKSFKRKMKKLKKVFEDYNDPNPKNFTIEKRIDISRYTILKVKYPDCTNYEGLKILFFKDIFDIPDQEIDFLDPHFCESGHLSPMARFEPTDSGVEAAIFLAHQLAERYAKSRSAV